MKIILNHTKIRYKAPLNPVFIKESDMSCYATVFPNVGFFGIINSFSRISFWRFYEIFDYYFFTRVSYTVNRNVLRVS